MNKFTNQLLKGFFTFVLSIFILGCSVAQTKDNAPQAQSNQSSFTLKQCVDYALQNQSSFKNATLGEAIAKARVGEITAAGLPQIKGSIQLSTNDPLRRMFLAGNSPILKTFSAPGTASVPLSEAPKVVAIPNIFQLASGADAGLSISQLIFSSSYIIGLQAAKTYLELSTKVSEQTRLQVVESVTKAYYMVLINEERLKLFENNVNRVDSLLFQIKGMHQNGMVESIDVDRIQVTYNNIATEKEKFKNLLLLSKALLQYQMAMPLNNELILTEKISDFKVADINTASQKSNYTNRIEYSLLESQKKLQLLDVRNNKAAYLPTLAAFANLGYFSQSPKFDYFNSTNLWYNYGLFGISMNIPIFDGFGQVHKMQQSKLNLQIIENNISNIERTIDLQIKSSEIMLKNSLSSLELQNRNIDLAKEVARVTKIKYKEGVGSSLEVTTAESSFMEAQTNYYNALYDALIAKVDYDKAIGILK